MKNNKVSQLSHLLRKKFLKAFKNDLGLRDVKRELFEIWDTPFHREGVILDGRSSYDSLEVARVHTELVLSTAHAWFLTNFVMGGSKEDQS